MVMPTRASLHAFFAIMLAIAAINGAVGAYQATLTPAQLAGWGDGYNKLVNGIGVSGRTFFEADGKQEVRPPGLGSDMGFAGNLGATALPGGIVLLLAYRRRRWPLLLVVLGLVGAIVGVVTSQSRSAMVMAVVMVLATLVLMAVGRQVRRSVVGLCAIGLVVCLTVMTVESVSRSTFDRYSSITPSKFAGTTVGQRQGTWDVILPYMREIPFGAGIGSGGSAAGLFDDRTLNWNAESQFNFLIVEGGIPLLVVFLGFQCALFAALFTGLRRERDPHVVLLMAGMAAPLVGYAAGWPIGITTTFTPDAAYLWFATGVIGYWLVTRHRARGGVDAVTRARAFRQPVESNS
jgi:O-antigen ligase